MLPKICSVLLFLTVVTVPRLAHSKSGSSSTSGKSVHVSGYTRKDGTYVAPYDRAAPGSGSSKSSSGPRVSARSTSTTSPRITARGQDDEGAGARTAAPTQPRTTARGIKAEADDPSAGTDNELALERARRVKAEEDAAELRRQINDKRDELKAATDKKVAEQKRNRDAESKFQLAKLLWDQGKKDPARKHLNEVIELFPGTPAAEKARTFLVK